MIYSSKRIILVVMTFCVITLSSGTIEAHENLRKSKNKNIIALSSGRIQGPRNLKKSKSTTGCGTYYGRTRNLKHTKSDTEDCGDDDSASSF